MYVFSQIARLEFDIGSELVVEWRALTVCLLDRVGACTSSYICASWLCTLKVFAAEGMRTKLGLSAEQLPLAKVLQGGTWAAGRAIALERRGGAPPIGIRSDGTVF